MKFALFYSDTEQFVAARDDRDRAVVLARELSAHSGREITVVYNDPCGETDVCCKFHGAFAVVVGGHCLGPVRRWLLGMYRRLVRPA